MRIDATRTAYGVYSGAEQPPLGAHPVCAVPPRTQAHAVTRDSRNRARRKMKKLVEDAGIVRQKFVHDPSKWDLENPMNIELREGEEPPPPEY